MVNTDNEQGYRWQLALLGVHTQTQTTLWTCLSNTKGFWISGWSPPSWRQLLGPVQVCQWHCLCFHQPSLTMQASIPASAMSAIEHFECSQPCCLPNALYPIIHDQRQHPRPSQPKFWGFSRVFCHRNRYGWTLSDVTILRIPRHVPQTSIWSSRYLVVVIIWYDRNGQGLTNWSTYHFRCGQALELCRAQVDLVVQFFGPQNLPFKRGSGIHWIVWQWMIDNQLLFCCDNTEFFLDVVAGELDDKKAVFLTVHDIGLNSAWVQSPASLLFTLHALSPFIRTDSKSSSFLFLFAPFLEQNIQRLCWQWMQ